MATGLFATKGVNPSGADGLFYGNPRQLLLQLVAALAAITLSVVITWALARLLRRTIGLRVSVEGEQVGLDISEHGERAYV